MPFLCRTVARASKSHDHPPRHPRPRRTPVSMGAFQRIEERLEAGGPVILDGAIGTKLERLGAHMDQGVWCARALADSPDMVHEVHRCYLDAGADVITANSYSATRETMQRHGLAAYQPSRSSK